MISNIFLPAVIALIMLNLGLSLSYNEVKKTLTRPKAIIVGLISQMALLPGLAFLLAYLSGLDPVYQIGIVLIAACPGGATSNLIAYLLKGNVSLSITLTSINSLLILISIPFLMFLGFQVFSHETEIIKMPFLQTVAKILLMILLPAGLGFLYRLKNREKARKFEKILKYISTGLLAIVYLFAIITNQNTNDFSYKIYLQVVPFVLALNVMGMLSGYAMARIFKFDVSRIITMSVEVGIQNSALAITLATSSVFIGQPKMAIPAIVYGLFTFFNAIIFGIIMKRLIYKEFKNKRKRNVS